MLLKYRINWFQLEDILNPFPLRIHFLSTPTVEGIDQCCRSSESALNVHWLALIFEILGSQTCGFITVHRKHVMSRWIPEF
nr:hypothetical transcript [Hymenolepis microstoma]